MRLKQWVQRLRHWLATILARIFGKVHEPSIDREFALLDDYLRIQQLRQSEERRFRRMYAEMRL
jgi:hypothetical protein